MIIMMKNKESDDEVIYNDVQSYLHGAVGTYLHGVIGSVPAVELSFSDGSTATFTESEWNMFILKR